MYCSACGSKLDEHFQFCSQCGRPTHPDRTSPWGVPRRLTRPLWDKKIGGVCAGFARYFDMDVSIMRILWLVLAIFTGVGFIAYLVAWIAMPGEEFLAMPAAPQGGARPGAPPPPTKGDSMERGGDQVAPMQA
jgi:phage shock protein C